MNRKMAIVLTAMTDTVLPSVVFKVLDVMISRSERLTSKAATRMAIPAGEAQDSSEHGVSPALHVQERSSRIVICLASCDQKVHCAHIPAYGRNHSAGVAETLRPDGSRRARDGGINSKPDRSG